MPEIYLQMLAKDRFIVNRLLLAGVVFAALSLIIAGLILVFFADKFVFLFFGSAIILGVMYNGTTYARTRIFYPGARRELIRYVTMAGFLLGIFLFAVALLALGASDLLGGIPQEHRSHLLLPISVVACGFIYVGFFLSHRWFRHNRGKGGLDEVRALFRLFKGYVNHHQLFDGLSKNHRYLTQIRMALLENFDLTQDNTCARVKLNINRDIEEALSHSDNAREVREKLFYINDTLTFLARCYGGFTSHYRRALMDSLPGVRDDYNEDVRLAHAVGPNINIYGRIRVNYEDEEQSNIENMTVLDILDKINEMRQ